MHYMHVGSPAHKTASRKTSTGARLNLPWRCNIFIIPFFIKACMLYTYTYVIIFLMCNINESQLHQYTTASECQFILMVAMHIHECLQHTILEVKY